MRISIIFPIILLVTSQCTVNKSIRFTETDAFLDIPLNIPDWMYQEWIYVGSSLDEDVMETYKGEVVLFEINHNQRNFLDVGHFEIQFSDNTKHTFTCMSYYGDHVLTYKRVISSPGKPNITQYCLVAYNNNNETVYRSLYYDSDYDAESIDTLQINIPLATSSLHPLLGQWKITEANAFIDINCIGDWRVIDSNQFLTSMCINLQQIDGLFLYQIINSRASGFAIYRLDNDTIYGSDIYLTIEEARSNLVAHGESVTTIRLAQRIVPSE